ncbi:MAG: DNA polymerase III subunit beta, partial [Deltaproteobacteria bacterium]|nr:DNA polymerase III subunit beta [Deltaproteobacteria bacterium]
MKLVINKQTFVNALQIITPITDKTSSKPILSNFLLSAEGEGEESQVEFSATDYEISIRGTFKAQVKEPGTVCISAKRALEICREFLNDSVDVQTDEQMWVSLSGGPARLRLPSVDMGLYPTMEKMDLPHRFKIGTAELKRSIQLTLFATLTNETRKNLMGVCLNLHPSGRARFVATDGHRLAQVDRNVELLAGKDAPEIIIPRKTLLEMQRILDRAGDTVEIGFDERNLMLTSEDMVMTTRLIEGKFPNVDPVIPKDNDRLALVNRERLANALKIISIMSNDKIKPVKLSLTKGLMRLESERAEYGDVADELPVTYSNEELKIGFNAKYLLDVLNEVSPAETVELKLKGALNPCLIQVPDDKGFLAVVMP